MTAAAWKTSAGAAARLPIARATNLNRTLRAYADAGCMLIGLDGEAPTELADLTEDLAGPVVLVVGSEGEGLSRLLREACDRSGRDPDQRHGGVPERRRRRRHRAVRDLPRPPLRGRGEMSRKCPDSAESTVLKPILGDRGIFATCWSATAPNSDRSGRGAVRAE